MKKAKRAGQRQAVLLDTRYCALAWSSETPTVEKGGREIASNMSANVTMQATAAAVARAVFRLLRDDHACSLRVMYRLTFGLRRRGGGGGTGQDENITLPRGKREAYTGKPHQLSRCLLRCRFCCSNRLPNPSASSARRSHESPSECKRNMLSLSLS